MGPRAGVEGCGRSCLHRDSITGTSSQQRVATPTELQGRSNMTGTNCDLFIHKSVPVIFETPCIMYKQL